MKFEKIAVSGIMLILLSIGMLTLAFNIQPVKAEPAEIVVPDNYLTIQEAVNNANPGDTIFVRTGTYYEHIIVDKPLTLIGESKSATIIDGGESSFVRTAAVNITADNVVFKGFTTRIGGFAGPVNVILNNSANTEIVDNNLIGSGQVGGVSIFKGRNITITGNRIIGRTFGIVLSKSFNNTVTGNNLTDLTGSAIWLSESSNNTIAGNSITSWEHPEFGFSGTGIRLTAYPAENGSSYNTFRDNDIRNCSAAVSILYYQGGSRHHDNIFLRNNIANNSLGVDLWHSSNFTFKDNTFSKNTYNLGVHGIDLLDYIHDIDTSNTVNGKPVYYLVNQQNLAINPTTAPNVGYLALINSTNITVENLDLTENVQGLLMASTGNSQIIKNNIAGNDVAGIYFDILSFNSTVSGNSITDQDWAGVLSNYSFNNTLIDNTVSNNKIGVYLKTSFNNTLTQNILANNSRGGVWLDYSFNNTLVSNNIIDSSAEQLSDAGVSLYQSYVNKIFHNNFINNQRQVYTCPGNTWDDGYPSGGNYWSNYTGIDSNYDGIGDTPHIIDAMNQDRYPLMNPYGPDKLPPTTADDYDGTWHIVNFPLNLTAVDIWSGVRGTYYRIDGGPIQSVSAQGQPLITTEGANNTLEYWSVDEAGNEESHHILTGIKLDKTTPTIGIPSRMPDGDVLPDQSVTVTAKITDALSGIKNVTLSYTINDGAIWIDLPMTHNPSTDLYEAAIPQQPPGTLVKYKVTAYDNAQNPATSDNAGQYYVYPVIPEFPPAIILPLLMIITLLAIVFSKKTMFRNIKCLI